MELIKAHGGIGEYKVSPAEKGSIDALFGLFLSTLDFRKDADWPKIQERTAQFYEQFKVLFPGHELFSNSMGVPIVHYRGSVPYEVAAGGSQIVVRVNDSFNDTLQSAQLRVVSAPESKTFLTFALNRHYVLSCVDDVAEELLKREGGKVPGVREISIKQDGAAKVGRREFGLANVNDVVTARIAYGHARRLIREEGMKEELLNGLRADSVRTDDHGNACKALYADRLSKITARYAG